MSSWYSSWLPDLPSIDFALPSSIQRRFISFALKKSLGHLLKPGQLDVHQIESQIGSGHVQVKDVELDNEAINPFLSGLPIKLYDGSIAAVKAHIPWPNPLTSNLGFSIQSLHLTFHLVPVFTKSVVSTTANLAESVASVAETFIHDELTPREEATLRESFHPDLTYEHSHYVPGSMDPFLHVTDEEEFHSDVDPAGVSMFATLIERLLARFEFDAVDTKITIIHPEHACFTFSVAEVHYGTEDDSRTGGREEIEQTSGETRKVSISGLTLTARDLRPLLPSPTSSAASMASPVSPKVSSRLPVDLQSSHGSPSASPASSSSSLDEDTQLLMSQSLAYLPPRITPIASSPSSSVSSSAYQSAISTVPDAQYAADHSSRNSRTPSHGSHSRPTDISTPRLTSRSDYEYATSEAHLEHEDKMILSFGAEPIIIRLTTPPVSTSTHDLAEDSSAQHQPARYDRLPQAKDKPGSKQNMQLTCSAGVLACAFRAWHIRAILEMLVAFRTDHAPSVSAPAGNSPSVPNSIDTIFALGLNATMNMRAIVIILLPLEKSGEPHDHNHDTSLERYFACPLVPPRLVHGYVRIFLDGLSTSCLLSSNPAMSSVSQKQAQAAGTLAISTANVVTFTFALGDISIFALMATPKSASRDMELLASPIAITDHNLPMQYSATHVHPCNHVKCAEKHDYPQLPEFSILDWTNKAHWTRSAKISAWRTKSKPKVPKGRNNRTRVGVGVPLAPRTLASHDRFSGAQSTQTTHVPAITVNASLAFDRTQASGSELDNHVEVYVVPLHIFVDLGLTLGSNHALDFVDELLGSHTNFAAGSHSDEEGSDPDQAKDAIIFSDTPHERSRKERETERRRLERLVLEDLDLDLDYRDNVPTTTVRPGGTILASHRHRLSKFRRSTSQRRPKITMNLHMIRFQIRCPPPPSRAPRSGAIILDLHDIRLFHGMTLKQKPATRFVGSLSPSLTSHAQEGSDRDALLTAQFQRIVVASSIFKNEIATIILSLGSLSCVDDAVHDSNRFGTSTSSSVTADCLPLNIVVSRTEPATKPSSRFQSSNAIIVTIDVPSIHADISKPLLDALQLWVDDVSQLVEQTFGCAEGDTDTNKVESRNPSLIGSRFFAKPRRFGSKSSEDSSISSNGAHAEALSETVIKVAVSEAFVRLRLPREGEQVFQERPFDILVSDVDLLIELMPDGKDETVITLGVTDLNIIDTVLAGSPILFVSLTAQSSLTSTPKPMVKLRFISLVVPETTAKETRIKLTLWGFTYDAYPDPMWLADLGRFFKAPPGAFETVIPSERTQVEVLIMEGSIRGLAPTHPGIMVFYVGELAFSTDLVGDPLEFSFHLSVPSVSVFFIDSLPGRQEVGTTPMQTHSTTGGISYWKGAGYALLAETADLDLNFQSNNITNAPNIRVVIDHVDLRVHLCADTPHAVVTFISDLTSVFRPAADMSVPKPKRRPTTISEQARTNRGVMYSVDEHAFRRVPDVGPAPDMINDDLPSNLDYLDAAFGTAAGLRELRDDDLDEFDPEEVESGRVTPTHRSQQLGITSNVGGETIRMLRPLNTVEHHFDTLPPDSAGGNSETGETTFRFQVHNCDVVLFLYDGYDWARTRKAIEEEVKEMRRRLAKIRQLVANGQAQDPSMEETSTLLFNSVYIGLEQDVDELETGALIAAIDEELNDDIDNESQSSWQSLHPPSTGKSRLRSPRVHGKRLTRSKGPSIEFRLSGLDVEFDQYCPGEPFVSRAFVVIRDVEILDHIKTSTWQKFLTELRSDSRGNVRETDSNMVRVELCTVNPVPNYPSEEARLRAKILPLRLYIDQDALDFLKKFFSFQDSDKVVSSSESSDSGIYFQHAEVFPVDIKLDYKPRRVDYRALREGRTIELMNFFHFDGSEMTLRHITMSGITGWPRFFDMLNDLWTPDVKATQLVDFISGVSPIRSMVNVGSGVADLVLLPIAQYKKDGRIVRGMQKGTTSFVKSTAMEAIKLGARLATGTQVILEQAEHVLGGQFKDSITTETLQVSPIAEDLAEQELGSDGEGPLDMISKYAEQPIDIKEGMQSAYKSLQRNLNSAAQTILAVPMEVYERSGNEGPVQAVIRAVPIAVLKPMIGASEAVSKTLMGLQNTMDPNIRHENEDKYKHR